MPRALDQPAVVAGFEHCGVCAGAALLPAQRCLSDSAAIESKTIPRDQREHAALATVRFGVGFGNFNERADNRSSDAGPGNIEDAKPPRKNRAAFIDEPGTRNFLVRIGGAAISADATWAQK